MDEHSRVQHAVLSRSAGPGEGTTHYSYTAKPGRTPRWAVCTTRRGAHSYIHDVSVQRNPEYFFKQSAHQALFSSLHPQPAHLSPGAVRPRLLFLLYCNSIPNNRTICILLGVPRDIPTISICQDDYELICVE